MSKIIVLDFYASWCTPCKRLEPYFKELQIKYPSYEFKKINIEDDNNKEIVDEYEVTALPTIVILENSKVRNKIVGFDIDVLQLSLGSL